MEKIAVIDLGTNTFHLLIAQVSTNTCQILKKEKATVKIGQDGISDGIINIEAYKRALDALDYFKSMIDAEGIKEVHASATSAIRNAGNGQALVDEVFIRTGIKIQIITGDQEAEFIFHGVKSALKIGKEPNLIMDIGGGSVEFIICNEDTIFWKNSFEIGAQRLLDKFHIDDPMTSKSRKKIYEFMEDSLQPLTEAIKKYSPKVLIGCSGTFDTLAEIYHKENNIKIDIEAATEISLPIDAYHKIHDEIITKNKEERLKIPGMIEMRVDMIVVASCLIKYTLQHFHFTNIRVSAHALKEGMLYAVVNKLKHV